MTRNRSGDGRTDLPSVHVYDTLRTAHLERAAGAAPTIYIYRHRSYDWDDAAAGTTDVRRLGARALLMFLLRQPVAVLEVNEPLMRPGVLRAALACVAVSISDMGRRRRTRVVTYAIDNRDPYRSDPVVGARSRVRRALEHRAARLVWRRVDRVVYGTDAARDAYRRALPPLPSSSRSVRIPHLPAACACLTGAADARPPDERVVFVGALNERKGVPQLLAAWPLVRERAPEAQLSFLGKGDLEGAVRSAAFLDLGIELVADPSRDAIHAGLRRSGVAVLFSQPRPRWREQVGLPIVEALAHGCAVVASDETGLASWLTDHGHTALPASASPTQLSDAIVAAILADRDRGDVLASLPDIDGRAAAERWLFP